jgi:hypothetical protein
MLYREIIAVCSEIHTKHTNTLCWKNAGLMDVKKNWAFCPHSAFMRFVWIWELTAIISLHSINWLVFVTDMQCVYCEVGIKFSGPI